VENARTVSAAAQAAASSRASSRRDANHSTTTRSPPPHARSRGSSHADVLPSGETHARAAVEQLYGLEQPLSVAALERLAEGWRPFPTWVMVAARAVGDRLCR